MGQDLPSRLAVTRVLLTEKSSTDQTHVPLIPDVPPFWVSGMSGTSGIMDWSMLQNQTGNSTSNDSASPTTTLL
jgi:hypothetical protein